MRKSMRKFKLVDSFHSQVDYYDGLLEIKPYFSYLLRIEHFEIIALN